MTHPSTRPRRGPLTALVVAVALVLGLVGPAGPTAPAGAAPGTGTGPHGQTLTVSDVDDLDPTGVTVTVAGEGFDIDGFDLATEGMYLGLCVDNGPAVPPSPCVGGIDAGGDAGASRWITNAPYPGAPAVPIAADGSFETTLTIAAADGSVDCLDLPAGQECKIVTRMDHRSAGDRSQDVKVPVGWAEPAPGPSLTVSPSGGLFTRGQDVVVTGSGYPMAGPGVYVLFGPEPEGNQDSAPFGNQAFVPTAAMTDGSFTVTLTDVEPTYTDGDGVERDFTDGGGFISTIRAHGAPDPDGTFQVSVPVSFRARTATESFVTAAHVDFLGEEPTRAVLASDSADLLGGTSRSAYLRDMSTSDTWLRAIVDDLYQDTLGRDGFPGEVAYWSDRLRSGWSVAKVAALFYASPEYYAGIGGDTDETWVRDLYQKILLRGASDADVAYWTGQVTARGRGDVALRMYQSQESAGTRVKGLYQTLLGRGPSAGDLDYWRPIVVARGDLTLAVALAASPEYLARAATRFP